MQVKIPFIDNNTDADSCWKGAYDNEMATKSGVYPIAASSKDVWHTAIHVSNLEKAQLGKSFMRPLLNGTIVAYRIAREYEYTRCEKASEFNYFRSVVPERLENAQWHYPEIYKKITGDAKADPLTIRRDIVRYKDSDTLDALSLIINRFSTSFVLVKHLVRLSTTAYVPFFILYSNFAPVQEIEDGEQYRCFFRKWTIKGKDLKSSSLGKFKLYYERTLPPKPGDPKPRELDLSAINSEAEILDTEKQVSGVYWVEITYNGGGKEIGYAEVVPNATITAKTVGADSDTVIKNIPTSSGYLGMQGRNVNNAIHIELFFPLSSNIARAGGLGLKEQNIIETADLHFTREQLQSAVSPASLAGSTFWFPTNVYTNKALYEKLNELIIKCPSIWDTSKEPDPADYNYTQIPEQIRRRYIESIKKQLWLTQTVKQTAMGISPGVEKFYYMHPFTFLKHIIGNTQTFDFSFNPYAGTHTTTDGISFICNSNNGNPGFVPRYTTGNDEYTFNNLHFAVVTGKFNQEYAHLPQYEKNWLSYHHEGVDFRGTIGTDVIALVEAVVLGFGWMGTYGKTLILANNKTKGVYLLGHLHSFMPGLKVDSTVYPLDVVAKSGQSSSGRLVNTDMPQHLHVSYFDYQYTGAPIIVNSAGTLSWVSGTLNSGTDVRDPFNHSVPKLKDTRKPKATERGT